jgi:hypothetical protein
MRPLQPFADQARRELDLPAGSDLVVTPESVTIDGHGLSPAQWTRLEQAGLVRAEPVPFPRPPLRDVETHQGGAA